MKTLTFSKLPSIGINPLTGEACAYSMRILCDLSEEGAELMGSYLGMTTPAFNLNWNSMVGDKPATASLMIERDMFSKIMIFALFREGFQFVMGEEHGTQFTGYSQDDLRANDAMLEHHAKVRNGDMAEYQPLLRVWVNPASTSTAPSVDGRNVHQASGRVS